MSAPPLNQWQRAAITRKRNQEARKKAEREAAAQAGDDEEEEEEERPKKKRKTKSSTKKSAKKEPTPEEPDEKEPEEPAPDAGFREANQVVPFRGKLPAEIRIKIYEIVAETHHVYYVHCTPGRSIGGNIFPARLKCNQFWLNGNRVDRPSTPIHSFEVCFEMREEILKRFKTSAPSVIDDQYRRLDFRHCPASTVFILQNGFWDELSEECRSQMQILATTDSRAFISKDNPEANAALRMDLLRPFPNLRKILFIEDQTVAWRTLGSVVGGWRQNIEFHPLTANNPFGWFRQRRANMTLAADYAAQFPDRKVPIAEMVYVDQPEWVVRLG